RPRLRAGRPAPRRTCALHHGEGDPPERDGADRRRGDRPPRLRDLRRRRTDVPRIRRPAAVARLVAADRGQLPAPQLGHLLVDGAVPGACDRDADHRRQPDRRRPAAGGGSMTVTEELTPPTTEHAPLALELEDLDVVYQVRGRDRQVLRGVTLN